MAGAQGRDSTLAEREWSKRSARYLVQLAKLKERLSEPVYRFITTKGLHNSQLTSIDTARQGRLAFVLSRSGRELLLEMSGVKKWIVDYADSKQSLELGRSFEWGYEEFSAAGAKSHATRCSLLLGCEIYGSVHKDSNSRKSQQIARGSRYLG